VDESESTDTIGVCVVKRKGRGQHRSTFSMEDARRAGLLNKQGPWQQYTSRQLKLRARGFALRDVFADVLAGLVTTEEAMDIPADQPAQPEPPAPKSLKDKLREQVEQPKESTKPAPDHVIADGYIEDYQPIQGKTPGKFKLATEQGDLLIGFLKEPLVVGITEGKGKARCTFQLVKVNGKMVNDLVKPIEWLDEAAHAEDAK
jgi:hypothetical protein